MASVGKYGVAGASDPTEKRKLTLLILRLQLVLAALMTLVIGCLAVPAQLAAQRYDSAPHCAASTQGPDCIALVPVTVASIGQATNGRRDPTISPLWPAVSCSRLVIRRTRTQ
jgi:hypothetical protein